MAVKTTKTTKTTKTAKKSVAPAPSPASVTGMSWEDKYNKNSRAIESLLWGSRHCGQLRGKTLEDVKSVLKQKGPDGILSLLWLGPPAGKNNLAKDLHVLLKA
jgi:hypothetical protein